MKIATKTGDHGITGTLDGDRLSKSHIRIHVVGDIDELNAAIGLCKVLYADKLFLEKIQFDLINIMGQLSYLGVDYAEKFSALDTNDLAKIDAKVEELQERPDLQQKSWVLYGKTELGARFDFAAKVCRRAERTVVELSVSGIILKYLNRLSDLLYLNAREADLCPN